MVQDNLNKADLEWISPVAAELRCQQGAVQRDKRMDGRKQFHTLRWRHNGCDGISNHQPHNCLLNHLFRCRSKKTSKLCATGLCLVNSPGTGEFPAQMTSNAKNVSISWRHHGLPVFLRIEWRRKNKPPSIPAAYAPYTREPCFITESSAEWEFHQMIWFHTDGAKGNKNEVVLTHYMPVSI